MRKNILTKKVTDSPWEVRARNGVRPSSLTCLLYAMEPVIQSPVKNVFNFI